MPQGPQNRRPWNVPRGLYPTGDPRWARLRKSVTGAPADALSLPSVITLGVNGTSATGANLIGSITPNTTTLTPFGPPNAVPNPSFEYDTVGFAPAMWSGPSNLATNLASSSWADTGAQSLHVVTNALTAAQQGTVFMTGPDSGPGAQSANFGWSGSRVKPWLQAGGSFVTQVNSMSGSFQTYLEFWCYDSAGTFISAPTTPAILLTGSGTFAASGTVSLPSNTAWFRVSPIWLCVTNGTLDVNVDSFQLALNGNPVPTYFDGDQTGYTWLGLPGKSPSQQTGTWWWFTYGTSLPLPATTITSPTYVGTGTLPLTVTAPLAALNAGQTYYVAMVGQNASGTIYGQTLAFVAQVATPGATQPVVPYGQATISIPHFRVPVAAVTSGPEQGILVVEQDTNEDVLSCVTAIALCPQGACPQVPTFGIPQPTFAQGPVGTDEITQAIQELEPRATLDTVTQALSDGQTWNVALEVTTTSANQLS